MAFQDNQLLFGSDPTPRIVAIELGETGTVKVYRREKDGTTACEVEEFHPFVWADGDVADLGLTNAEKLAGDAKYNWLVTTDSWKELIALRNGLKKAGRNFFALSDPVQHYLTQTGRTLFKQLPFEELKRMQIEVLSFAGGDLEAAAGRSHHEHRGFRQHRLGGTDRGRSARDRGIGARRDQAPDESDQGTRPGRDRGSQPVSSSICRFSSPARARRRRNSIGDEAAASCARGRRGSRSRRRRSIIRSSRSRAGISSTPFCSRNFTTSGCVRFPVSSGAMSRSTLA